MWWVRKGYFALETGRCRKVTEAEQRLLQDDDPASGQWPQRMRLIAAAREQGEWLLCDCQQPEYPVLFPRCSASGVYSLVHHKDYPHSSSCAFRRTSASSPGEGVRRQRTTDFCFHRKPNLSPQSPAATEPRGSRDVQHRENSLIRCLSMLLELAELNVLQDYGEDHPDAMAMLLSAASRVRLDGQPLSEWLYTDWNDLAAAKRRLYQINDQRCWPGRSGRPQCLFILPIDQFAEDASGQLCDSWVYQRLGEAWQTERYTFDPAVPLVRPERLRSDDGPYLLIFTVSDANNDENKPHFKPLQAALVPVLTKPCPLPLDSYYERVVYQFLRKHRASFARNAKIPIRVIKPLSDIETALGACRPDVILELGEIGGKTRIIEVMGSEDADYLASKAMTIPRMMTIGPVDTFNAFRAEQKGRLEEWAEGGVCNQLRLLINDPDPKV